MYSILLKVTTCSSDRWKYLQNDDGSIYQEEDLEKVRLKVIQLLSDNVLSAIKVVANKRAISHIVIEGNPDEPGQWLPEVTVDDNGKVLMVIDGEWDKGTIEVGSVLPDVTTDDNGKILKVVNGEWTAAEDETGTDEKVKQILTSQGVYDILLSGSAKGGSTEIETVKKSEEHPLTYNTHGGILIINNDEDHYVSLGYSGVGAVSVHSEYDDGISYSSLRHNDLTLQSTSSTHPSTWDGTNSSLKTTIASLQSRISALESALTAITSSQIDDICQ